jgi:hypothetical protein
MNLPAESWKSGQKTKTLSQQGAKEMLTTSCGARFRQDSDNGVTAFLVVSQERYGSNAVHNRLEK